MTRPAPATILLLLASLAAAPANPGFADKYGVAIEPAPAIKDRYTTYHTLTRDTPGYDRVADVVTRELSVHPPAFIRATGLKAVWIARQLTVGGQPRAAVVLQDRGTLVINVDAPEHRNYLRHGIQHELYHLVELTTAGDFYFKDPKWAALNPPGTTYGSGGRHEQDSAKDPGRLDHPAPGFVSRYAQSGIEEDKAETFACLSIPEERILLDNWCKSDHSLAAKVRRTRDFIAWWSEPQDPRLLDLMRALADDDATVIEKLLSATPALASQPAWNGWRPLHWAAARGATRSIPLLAKHVDVNARDEDGWTPLHVAAAANDQAAARKLLNLGADPKLRDKSAKTPADRAQGRLTDYR
jgi:hypothetical protein